MDPVVLAVFVFVYLGMILGEVPGLALDRSGIALLGAIVLIATNRIAVDAAWRAIDVPTVALLFGLMVVSAQFRLGGFYAAVVGRIDRSPRGPGVLLALVVIAAALLSAVLANDIVCLAMAPMLIEACVRRRWDPVPFLLALACASNVGSAATLIGNPQNMLIGQTLKLSFVGYLRQGGIPSMAGLAVVWLGVWLGYRGRWEQETGSLLPRGADVQPLAAHGHLEQEARSAFSTWQTWKGLAVVGCLMAAFILAPWPREQVALAGAGVLLTSRKMASREMLGLVDWHLLVLFIGLFVVNASVAQSGLLSGVFLMLRQAGLDVGAPATLFGVTTVLSNLISNVPAVMLLLPAARHDLAGPVLALSSTLAGNLLIVGSIANIIVVDQARRLGIGIDWRTHARTGIPVTLGTLALAGLWLWAAG